MKEDGGRRLRKRHNRQGDGRKESSVRDSRPGGTPLWPTSADHLQGAWASFLGRSVRRQKLFWALSQSLTFV